MTGPLYFLISPLIECLIQKQSDYIHHKKMLIKSLKYLMVATLPLNSDEIESIFLKRVYRWYSNINKGLTFMFILAMFLKLIRLVLTRAESDVTYECFSIFLTALGAGVKILIYQKSNALSLFEVVLKAEKEIMSLDEKLIVSYKRNIRVFIKVKNGVILLCAISFVILFVFKYIMYKRDENIELKSVQEFEKPVIVPIWLPFDERNNLLYTIIINFVFLFGSCNIYAATQVISFAFMIFIIERIKIIRNSIRNLDSDCKDTSHYKELSKIVSKHLFIIRFTNKVNKYTSSVMLTSYLIFAINLASLVTQTLMYNTVAQLVFPVIYILNVIIYIFLLGWFANEIKVQSLALGDALYETTWYTQDVRSQKLLLLMIQNTQRPLTMSIGNFGPMTLETAINTIRAAYSFVTVMRSF